ncbi:efflux RND transporter periplasmic adaptor subunit [bacterium]|nr:efflux RND transporter periplasmic adaptor subunit [bacterium]
METPRVAPLKWLHLRRQRARLPGVVVFLLKQQVDLGRGAAERRLLQQRREGPDLLEIGRQQLIRQSLRLAQVVLKVRAEPGPVVPKRILNLAALDVCPLRAVLVRDPEIDRHLLEPIGRQLPGRDVVELDEQVGIDHGAPGQVAAGKINPTLGHLQPGVAKCGPLPVAAPRARNLQAPATLPQVVQVELEDVVALDDVRIEARERRIQRLEESFLRRIGHGLQQEEFVAPRAAQADRQHAILRLRRIGKVAARGARFDVELATAELAAATANAVTARRARDLATLRSPIAGVVTRLSAVLGASADAGQSLVEVSDPSVLDVVVALDPVAASTVHRGQSVTLFAGAAADGAPVARGTVADVAMAVDTASRGVSVRVAVDNMSRPLRFGETVFARVSIADHAAAVVVPIAALVPTGEGFRVFVVDDEGIAHARDVKVGARSDHGIWVREGLKAGEKVVTTGAYGMDDSAKVVGKREAKDEKDPKDDTRTKPGAKAP